MRQICIPNISEFTKKMFFLPSLGTEAGKDFLFLFENAQQEQKVVSMHSFIDFLLFKDLECFSK